MTIRRIFFKGCVAKVYIVGGSQKDFFRGGKGGEISLFPLEAKKTNCFLKM